MKQSFTDKRVRHILLFWSIVAGCSTPAETGIQESSAPQLLFLAYQAQRDSATGAIEVALIFQMDRAGRIAETPENLLPKENDWIISFLDAKNKVLERRIINDPFVKDLEGVNESGLLERTKVRQKKAEVMLRLNRLPAMKRVQIETIANNDRKKIFEHSLNRKQ